MSHEIVFSRRAQKDAKKLKKGNLKGPAAALLDILREKPFQNPPRYEALVVDLSGCYSR